MSLFQTIFVPLCGLIALAMLIRAARGHILPKNGLFWATVWLTAAGVIAFPSTTQIVAGWLGIGRGTDLVLYLAILGGLGAALHFYVRFRRIEGLLTGVIRREALDAPQMGGPAAPSNRI